MSTAAKLESLARLHLLIIDELGYIPINNNAIMVFPAPVGNSIAKFLVILLRS